MTDNTIILAELLKTLARIGIATDAVTVRACARLIADLNRSPDAGDADQTPSELPTESPTER